MTVDDFMLHANEREALALLLRERDAFHLLDLSAEDFTDLTYREIFKAVKEVVDSGNEVSLMAVTNKLPNVTVTEVANISGLFHVSIFGAKELGQMLRQATVVRKLKFALDEISKPEEVERVLALASNLTPRLSKTSAMSGAEFREKYIKHHEARLKIKEQGGTLGLLTGFYTIDEHVPMKPGDLITLAAKTSIGKSALSLGMAVGAAMYEQNVLFCSAEMSWQSLGDRLMSVLSGGKVTDIENANDEESQAIALEELKHIEKHLNIHYMPRMTSADVIASAKKIAGERKLDLIVVDYLQYLADRNTSGNLAIHIGEITQKFKQLAGELECVVLLLSQVNRKADDTEDGMPRLQHLRSSGSIEQDSDVVLILHRPTRDSHSAEVMIAKARRGRAGDVVRLDYNPETTKFKDPARKKHVPLTVQKVFHDMLN